MYLYNSINNCKRLLIIGASGLQLPAIQKAKEMGLCVAVADYNPAAIGIPFADEYYNVSTIDEVGVYQAAKDFGADGIITLATDMPMRAVAYACCKLGLIGISYDTAIKSTDKAEMIKAFQLNGLDHPWFYVLSGTEGIANIREEITYPCISKPTDNAGSRGVMWINRREDLSRAVHYSSKHGRNGSVIIEEYMHGSEVSVEVIVFNGVPHVLAVTNKRTTGEPHFVEMEHSQPCCLSDVHVKEINQLACRAVKAVGIENGPAHVEIMLTADGPKMIELGARMGGDCITTHLVPLSTGVDMVKATIQIALGETPDLKRRYQRGAAIRYFYVPNGVIQSIDGVENASRIDGVKEITFIKNVGDTVDDFGNSNDRVGYVIAQGNNAKDAIGLCEAATENIRISINEVTANAV